MTEPLTNPKAVSLKNSLENKKSQIYIVFLFHCETGGPLTPGKEFNTRQKIQMQGKSFLY